MMLNPTWIIQSNLLSWIKSSDGSNPSLMPFFKHHVISQIIFALHPTSKLITLPYLAWGGEGDTFTSLWLFYLIFFLLTIMCLIWNLASLYIKIQKRINYFSLFWKHFFIFKMGFRMSFHFQNVVLFRNVLSFSKCERFRECCFSFFRKTQL